MIKNGVALNDYYLLTFSEAKLYVEAFRQRKEEETKQKLGLIYEQAKLIVGFFGRSMNGEEIPKIEQIYDVFAEEEKDEEIKFALLKEQFIDYSEQYNRKRK